MKNKFKFKDVHGVVWLITNRKNKPPLGKPIFFPKIKEKR